MSSRPVIKLRWEVGPHYRLTIFTGMSGQTLANIGTLTVRREEASRLRSTIRQGIQGDGFEGIAESGWPTND